MTQIFAAAFIKAKAEFGPALKDKQNPHFRSRYADLGNCIDAVEQALLNHGIAFIQETFEDSAGVTVETVFLHESGEERRCGKLHVPATKNDAQGFGSALTYARRYSLMAACGIAPEDDDGNAASKGKKPARPDGKLIITPRGGIGDDLPEDWKIYLKDLAQEITGLVSSGHSKHAIDEVLARDNLDDAQRTYLEDQMDSKTRAALKKA